jgi:threonine dehydratase
VTRSFRTKTLQSCHNPDTIADGARTHSAGDITFPLILHYVHDMLTVNDTELARTMFWIWERMKIVVEPTGALAAAALLEGKLGAAVKGKRVGILISGGNVDLRDAARLLLKSV